MSKAKDYIPGRVTRRELNHRKHVLTEEQAANQDVLYVAINKVRKAWGRPMFVTSGVRSLEDHIRIYKELGRDNPPMGSAHLKGAAVDIWDRGGRLGEWCLDHEDFIKECGLFLEHPAVTWNWVHFQVIPPRSGKTFFYP